GRRRGSCRRTCSEQTLDRGRGRETQGSAHQLIVEREQIPRQGGPMGGDGGRVAARDRAGEHFLRPVLLQGGKRAGRQRQQRAACDLLGGAGSLPECV